MLAPGRFLLIVLGLLLFFSCRKQDEIVNDKSVSLNFSEDSVFFDTLFTSRGSTTHRLWVHNPDNNAVNIDEIKLKNSGDASYKLIVDGVTTQQVNDKKILGKDSLLILIEVTIDPGSQSLPFLVKDKLVFRNKGLSQEVPLVAWGQDAHFLKDSTLACATTWNNDKPYFVMDKLTVPASCNLTMNEGVRVYFENGASITIKGNVTVNGSKDSLVRIGDNPLTQQEERLFGRWQGMTFKAGSKNNTISYAVIENAEDGIFMAPENDGDTIPELHVDHSIFKNHSGACLRAYGTDVLAENCLFTNAADHAVQGNGGGNYYFRHCSITNYSFDFSRNGVAFAFNDEAMLDGNTVSNNLTVDVYNSLVWGSFTEELSINNDGGNTLNESFRYSLLRTQRNDLNNNGNIIDQDPDFKDESDLDFHLKSGSPAIDAGQSSGISTDLKGNSRDANPDMGAYEKL